MLKFWIVSVLCYTGQCRKQGRGNIYLTVMRHLNIRYTCVNSSSTLYYRESAKCLLNGKVKDSMELCILRTT